MGMAIFTGIFVLVSMELVTMFNEISILIPNQLLAIIKLKKNHSIYRDEQL